MYIEKVIETEDGKIEFKGTLQADELDFVLEVGLNVILAQGVRQHIQLSSVPEENPQLELDLTPPAGSIQ